MCQAKPRRQREGLTTQRTQLPKTRHMCVHERVRTHTLTHTPWEGSTSFIGAFGFRGHAIKTSCWERKRLCVLGWGAGMREQLQFLQDKGQARSVPPLPWGRKVRQGQGCRREWGRLPALHQLWGAVSGRLPRTQKATLTPGPGLAPAPESPHGPVPRLASTLTQMETWLWTRAPRLACAYGLAFFFF